MSMAQLAALILALAKVVPFLTRLLSAVVEAYATAQRAANANDEAAKTARDRADIAAAAERVRGQLCATCPFAGQGGGQHGAPEATPAVPASGDGSAGLCVRHV